MFTKNTYKAVLVPGTQVTLHVSSSPGPAWVSKHLRNVTCWYLRQPQGGGPCCQLTALLNPGQCMTLLSMCCSIRLYTKHSARHGCAESNALQSWMSQKLWGMAGLLVPEPLIWLFLNAYMCCLWICCWNVTTKASWKGSAAIWSR